MYTDTKARLSLVISTEADDKLRKLVFDHRKTSNLSEIVEAIFLTMADSKGRRVEPQCY